MSFVLLLLISSCVNHSNTQIKSIEEIMEEWHGKEIKLPDCFFRFSDDVMTSVRVSDSDNFRLISLISADCPGCIEDIFTLYQFYSEIKQYDNAEVIIILFARDYEYLLSHYGNQLPQDLNIYIDPDYKFFDYNNYPKKELFRTFLINRRNEIVLLGDPIYNNALQELYFNKINE